MATEKKVKKVIKKTVNRTGKKLVTKALVLRQAQDRSAKATKQVCGMLQNGS